MKKILSFALLSICFFTADIGAQITYWSQTGGPEAGTVNDITIDSSKNVFIWTRGSGVLRSSDSGSSWQLFNKGLPNLNMKFGAASKSGYLFAANQDQYKQLFRFNQNDPNAKWEEIVLLDSAIKIYDILAVPNGSLFVSTQKGIERSDDNGTTWLRKNVGFKDSSSVNSKPDSTALYLSLAPNGDLYVSSYYGAIFRSANNGDSWIRPLTRQPGTRFISAMLVASNENIVVGNFGNKAAHIGGNIYVSRDSGATWDSVYNRPANTDENKNDIDKLIRVPGSSVLYANAHGITLRSIDNGVNWVVMDSDKRGDEPFSMAAEGNNLYQMSEPDGVFLSANNGAENSWVDKSKGMFAQYMWGMSINSKQKLFTITEYGLHRSVDQGDTWDMAPEYGETYYPSLFIDRKDNIFIGTDKGLFKSIDDGENLKKVVIEIDPNGDNIIVQVGQSPWGFHYLSSRLKTIGFAFSTDDGDHWEQKVQGWDPQLTPEAFAFVDDTCIVSTNTAELYRSDNKANTWHKVTSDLPGGARMLLVHPDGSYLALREFQDGGVYRSINGGEHWTRIFPPEGLPVNIKQYYSMMVDRKGQIVVTTDSGVYYSNQNFSQWPGVSVGLETKDLPNHYVSVAAVVQNPLTGVFFAATKGLSVFKSIPNLGVSNHSTASAPIRVNASPNPFSTSTSISFALKNRCKVDAEVYDALGRNVKLISGGLMEEGEGTLTFDGSALPSGSYLVAVHAGEEIFTSWVTLTK